MWLSFLCCLCFRMRIHQLNIRKNKGEPGYISFLYLHAVWYFLFWKPNSKTLRKIYHKYESMTRRFFKAVFIIVLFRWFLLMHKTSLRKILTNQVSWCACTFVLRMSARHCSVSARDQHNKLCRFVRKQKLKNYLLSFFLSKTSKERWIHIGGKISRFRLLAFYFVCVLLVRKSIPIYVFCHAK